MKLRASLFAFLLASAPLGLLVLASPAGATTGDPLLVSTFTVAPGNPCNALGRAGGLAANEAGRLYYGVLNQTRIWIQRSVVSASVPPACLGSIVPAVTGTAGWTSLAYDATHAQIRLWGLRADGSGDVYGMTLTGAVLARFNHAGATGLAKDEGPARHVVVSSGTSVLARYAIVPSSGTFPFAAASAGTTTIAEPARALAPWNGAFLGVDWGYTVRNYDPAGTPLGLEFRPGYNYVDPWYQVQRASFWYADVAFDTASYAGRGAFWIVEETGGTYCIANCPIYTCQEYEGSTCLRWLCTQNCDPAGWTLITVFRPSVRAIEVVRKCADGTTPAPDAACLCKSPVPQPTFLSPTAQVYVRGAPTGTPAGAPTLVGGALAVTATGGPSHRITLTGPTLGVTGMGAATLIADAAALGRGAHTFRASLWDVATSCQGGTTQITIRVENPSMRTFAQALRIEGNVPLNLVLASVPVAPLDTLAGAESAVVADPASVGARHDLAARAFEAAAAHAPIPGAETLLAAEASARAVGLAGTIDLAGLCFDLTAQVACAALPWLALDEEVLAASARVDASLLNAALNPSASVNTASGNAAANAATDAATGGAVQPIKARSSHTAAPCPLGLNAIAVTNVNGLGAPVSTPPTGTPCSVTIGPFTVTLADTRATTRPLAAEARATAVRIVVSSGAYQGEIAIADAYAGITLDAGAAPLAGPGRALDLPNDYATLADAPASAAGSPNLAPGTYSGAFAADDRADVFTVTAAPGKKLKVVIGAAHRASVYATPAPTLPDAESSPRLLRLRLYDPDGLLRDDSRVAAVDAQPAEVELNVDDAGAWILEVTREDTLQERAPYTVHVALADAFMPNLDNAGANDAPSTCAGAPALPAQGVTHPMNEWDAADTWAVTVAAGESLTATMAPLDLEGANFDLRVLNSACSVVASSANGANPQPKGTPEAIADLELPAGSYFVQVVRANGIGDYALFADAVRDVPVA